MKTKLCAVIAVAVALLAGSTQAYAAMTATSTLTQIINSGTLSSDIRDASGFVVANPSFVMSGVTTSALQQSSTGTFGSTSQRIIIDNPGGASSGFSVTLNATVPGTGVWTDGGTNTYAYNSTAALGCLTVDPSVGTWTALVGTTTSITKGVSASFSGATPITIATASAAIEDIWSGYVTGIGLTQTIPANTPVGSYTISMTQTVTAL